MAVGRIASQWDSYAASVVYKEYQPPTWQQEELGLTGTIVIASVVNRRAGVAMPDGFIFADYSAVEATTTQPRISKDRTELHKDDTKVGKDLYGDSENEWHRQIREDLERAPNPSWYKNNKWYIQPRWDLADQLSDKAKQKVTKRIKTLKRTPGPDWLEKAYLRK